VLSVNNDKKLLIKIKLERFAAD